MTDRGDLSALSDGYAEMRAAFIDGGRLTAEQFDRCWTESARHPMTDQIPVPPIQVVADTCGLPIEDCLEILATASRAPFLLLDAYDRDEAVTSAFPLDLCLRWHVLPFDRMGDATLIATTNPFNRRAEDELRQAGAGRVLWYLAPPGQIAQALGRAANAADGVANAFASVLSPEEFDQLRDDLVGFGRALALTPLHSDSDGEDVVATGAALGLHPVRAERCRVSEALIDSVSVDLCRRHNVLPVARLKSRLYLAVSDPRNVLALDDVRFRTGLKVFPLIASNRAIADKLSATESRQGAALLDLAPSAGEGADLDDEDRLELHPGEGRLADSVLEQAIRDDVSEIRIEPSSDGLRVLRRRADGQVVDQATTPRAVQHAVMAHLKLRCELDVAERRAAQNGQFEVTLEGKRHEFSVSFHPTEHGERCVLRRQARTLVPPVDLLHFTVVAPPVLRIGATHVIDVWAHLAEQRRQVIEQARDEAGSAEIYVKSKGPARIERGSLLSVKLTFPDLAIDPPEDTIVWEGEAGNATFIVRVPETLSAGSMPGAAVVYSNSLQVCRLTFVLQIGAQPSVAGPIPTEMRRHRTAFASYASEDRDAVLGRIQGLQKGAPDLDVFIDVARLRSGQDWKEALKREVLSRDVLYLFWSEAASRSPWVDWEWHCGLREHGIGFIDPVPLVSPERVPPPPELGDQLHFNDWVLAYMRNTGPQ